MKTVVRVLSFGSVAVVLAFGLTLTAQAPPAKKVPVEQRLVTVPGDQPWVDVNVEINPRDRVTVTATGRVCFSGSDQIGCVSPDGYSRAKYQGGDFPADLAYCDDPMMDAGHGALIASVDNENVVIGSKLVFSGKSGTLRLGINDCTFTTTDPPIGNSGRFNATVKIERDAIPDR